ncbi:hypothetical protein [Bradyrhizobium sp. WD16]|uniref:hypothetical protein n=1 Tax=Bradyrhizobium sp. WD16 TaxID=1521768 RepID=UPI0020A53A56|nr:hypothetical protein [Bradyrhizobium sp. WD16]UTD30442.1 hypothetical protein DB459_14845 [Bradyrhizobium sp. WD16]
MPAFSFEKLSPPIHRETVPVAPVKPRGFIHQMLDRLAAARLRRNGHDETASMPSRAKRSARHS